MKKAELIKPLDKSQMRAQTTMNARAIQAYKRTIGNRTPSRIFNWTIETRLILWQRS